MTDRRIDTCEIVPFRCWHCGGRVRGAVGTGRTRLYMGGVERPIPDDFELPTCEICGEVYTDPLIEQRLDAVILGAP